VPRARPGRHGVARKSAPPWVKRDNNKVTTTEPTAKELLRRDLLKRRTARPQAALDAARAAVAAHALALAAARAWTSVAAYRPLRTEPGSAELLAGLSAAGLRVLTPVLLPDNDLTWTDEDGRDLGVESILDVDGLLVPALAVDRRGHRLGRGGGSYDRVLLRVRSTPSFALVFDDELLDQVPADPWDQPVSGVITASTVTTFER